MTVISSDLLRSTGLVTFGLSTRQGGVSPEPFGMNLSFSVGDDRVNVQKNRDLFFSSLGIREDEVALPGQVHSNVVQCAVAPGKYPSCDGLITNVAGLHLGISVADCIPVFIVETHQRVVAAIHAGWRGTSASIVQEGVQMMMREFGCRPEHMIAYIGPGASVCCYAVGQNVANLLGGEFAREASGNLFVDLKAANAAQLVDMGLPHNAIETSPYCTIDNSNLFHSFRRDKERSGRMMGVIGLKPAR